MPVYKGAYFSKTFTFKDKVTDDPINITGWTFEAHLRDNPKDSQPAAVLTTANGGFTVIDGVNGRLMLAISTSVANTLPTGIIHFDVLRTGVVPGPVWLFGGKFPVKEAVTRNV